MRESDRGERQSQREIESTRSKRPNWRRSDRGDRRRETGRLILLYFFPQYESHSLIGPSFSPRAPSNQGLPVVAATVDVDVARHAVVALAGEAVLALGLLGGRLLALHCQVVVGHLQLAVGRLRVQLERLACGSNVEFKK